MKKIIRTGVIMVALLSTMMNYANEVSYTTDTKEIEKTIVTLDNVKEGHELLIKDENGSILYREFIKESGLYTKGFDLTTYPDGNYYFELNKDLEIKITPFNVTDNLVVFYKEKETTIFKPVASIKDDKLLISRLSLDKKPMKLKIYYDNSYHDSGFYELIYSEKFKDETIVERIYKLDKTQKGNYKIVMKSEGRTFIEKVKL